MTKEETNVPVGVLCGQDVERLSKEQELIEPYEKSCVQACSYDLRIGTIFREGQVINEKHSKADEQVVIEPGEVVSVLTQDVLKLPNDITGTAFAINSQSREGLMVLNPGHVDPGFSGQLSVKAINLRKVALPISRGEKIFTVIFEKLPKMTDGYQGNMHERMQRERECNKKDLEVSPRSLGEMIRISGDCPFVTEERVKRIITVHWMTWLTLVLAGVAAYASLRNTGGIQPVVLPAEYYDAAVRAGRLKAEVGNDQSKTAVSEEQRGITDDPQSTPKTDKQKDKVQTGGPITE